VKAEKDGAEESWETKAEEEQNENAKTEAAGADEQPGQAA
jgi:hypothetical protein